ncbi:MAG: HPr family phosphocarrier protein, partial [Clostridiales bacterium]|nr:HPr family phosphocarrier protein [Clostridiales bacterium]
MTEKTIVTGLNLEARPAAILVQLASQYNSSVFLKRDNKT